MISFNLKDYKKVGSSPDATILEHKDGHAIGIKHSKIHPKMRAELEAMPHFADGGAVDSAPAQDPGPIDTAPAQSPLGWLADKLSGTPDPQAAETNNAVSAGINAGLGSRDQIMNDPKLLAKAQALAPQTVDPTPAPSQDAGPANQPQGPIQQVGFGNTDPYGYGQLDQSMQNAYQKQIAGIGAEAQASGAEGDAQAKALEAQQKPLEDLAYNYQQKNLEIDHERKNALQDMRDGHIDPNQYWANKSTGSKISTALGLILGGIGGGLLHQENPALKLLTSHIDNDINAQKMNLQQTNNVYNANRERFHDEQSATNMTRIMMNDSVVNQLKTAAAKAQSPIAQARAMQMVAPLEAQSAQLHQQTALRQAVMGGAANGSISPEMTIKAMVPKPEEQQAYFKELKSAQDMSAARDNLLSGFDRVSKVNTYGNRIFHPFNSQSDIDSAWDPGLAQLVKDSEGRITPADLPLINSFKPKINDPPQLVAQKRARLNAFAQQKMNFPMLKGIGIQAQNFGRFSGPGGQSKFALQPVVAPQMTKGPTTKTVQQPMSKTPNG